MAPVTIIAKSRLFVWRANVADDGAVVYEQQTHVLVKLRKRIGWFAVAWENFDTQEEALKGAQRTLDTMKEQAERSGL